MSKLVVPFKQSKKQSQEITFERIKKALSAKHACYVLLTCSAPTEKGQMEVELTYEGDEMLASFLIENASQVFDERMAKRESK